MVGNAYNCWNSGPVLFTTTLHSLHAKEFAAAFSGFRHLHSDVEILLDSKGETSHKQKPEFLTHRKLRMLKNYFVINVFENGTAHKQRDIYEYEWL